MAKKKKSIDATGITIGNDNLLFENVLDMLDGQTIINDIDRTVTVGLSSSSNTDIVLGYVKTTKKSGIPPAHDLAKDEYEKLKLTATQGLGYSNVFLYIKEYNILLYQFEQMGCYLPTFVDSVRKWVSNSDELEGNLLIKNSIVLRKEAMERILSFDRHRSIEFTILNPKAGLNNHLEENDALISNVNEADDLNANELTVKYSLKGNRIEGMPSSIISEKLTKLSNFMGIRRPDGYNTVTKIEVEGYLRDPSSDKEYRDSIDLITDKFKKAIVIDEPRVKGDTQIREKTTELENLYNKIQREIADLEIL
jgi:hypothetical protein